MRQPLQLAFGTNRARDGIEGAARCVNCYAEKIGPEAATEWALYPINGWDIWGTVTSLTGGVRATLALDSTLIAVIGRMIVQFDSGGGATVLGGFAADGPVTMARNRRDQPQVAICCNGVVAIVSGGAVTMHSDTDLKPATSVDCLDGYGLFFGADGRISASDLDNFLLVDGLSFAKAEANPDGGVRVKVRNREAVLYGRLTTEFWSDNGGDPFPLGRVTSVDVGCLAAMSVCDVDQTHAFVAHDFTVRMWSGYTAQIISTPEVARLIETDPARADIIGMSWVENGHAFYALTGSTWTKVYDTRTGLWHDRESYRYGRWRASTAVAFASKTIFGDLDTGTLYVSTASDYDEAGRPIVMTMQAAPAHAWPNRLRWNALHCYALPGQGLGATEVDPVIMLDWSDDGGHTWSVQRMVSVGQQGQKRTRVITRRLGVAPATGRTFRMSMSAAVARGFVNLAGDVDLIKVS